MKIAITGETGFLGYHLSQYITYELKHEVISLSRDYQQNINKLAECDWLIHCAGVNRGNDVGIQNINIVTELVNLLKSNNIKINISFISSVQEDLNNEYGNSKLECKDILGKYCEENNTNFISHKLPNLFGPYGKPNYNSVVATFCYNIVNRLNSQINDNVLKICYVYDAIKVIANFDTSDRYTIKEINVTKLYNLIKYFHELYSEGIIPKLYDNFEIQLFNTYRSFANNVHKFIRHEDDRGYLVELLKNKGSESQVFFSVSKPNIVRGNHFHFNKIERFCVIKGSAKICLRKLGSNEIISYIIDESMNTVIDIPILYTHNITNIGDSELICIFWSNEIFNKETPDTYFVNV